MWEQSCGIDRSPKTGQWARPASAQYNTKTSAYFHEICRRPKTLFVDALQTGEAVVAAARSRKRFVENSKVPMLLFFATGPGSCDVGADGLDEQVFWLRGRPTGPYLPSPSSSPAGHREVVECLELSSLVTAAEPPGSCTRLPILPQTSQTAGTHRKTTICCGC